MFDSIDTVSQTRVNKCYLFNGSQISVMPSVHVIVLRDYTEFNRTIFMIVMLSMTSRFNVFVVLDILQCAPRAYLIPLCTRIRPIFK